MRFQLGAGLSLQILKTALASAIAWWLAVQFLHDEYPYFAPLAAILTVQVTVADSLERALQRIIGIVFGVAISLIIGHWINIGALSIFLVILIGMVISNSFGLNYQITSQVAVSSLLVLAFGHNQGYAFGRIIETIVGCAVAVGINALMVPPNAIPKAESALQNLSKLSAETLKKITVMFETANDQIHNDIIEQLINETEKSLQALRLAKLSQKYSPFLAKFGSRLEMLTIGMEQLEKITVQIRGIRRSLNDLHAFGDFRRKEIKICEAMERTSECISQFGDCLVQFSAENNEILRNKIQQAQLFQLSCLNELALINSPIVLREIGAVLTDLNRILQEVSLELRGTRDLT
ncbi:FUSC family protein [Paenibacillus cremeus]|uniref:FUSC family protein n=1 Tax=Paenibacillus cremeus TaxID=2163881 RepID=UPI0016460371|nr:FUSC family protein [Paenibacillus cremeus]